MVAVCKTQMATSPIGRLVFIDSMIYEKSRDNQLV
jgi:hypothetical protein